jgi:hypothetical protein
MVAAHDNPLDGSACTLLCIPWRASCVHRIIISSVWVIKEREKEMTEKISTTNPSKRRRERKINVVMNRKSINNLLIASRHPGEGKMLHCDKSFDIPFSKDSDKCVSVCDGGMMKTKNKKKKKKRENVRAPIINMIQHGGLGI